MNANLYALVEAHFAAAAGSAVPSDARRPGDPLRRLADAIGTARERAGSAPAACPATASPCRSTSTGRCWRSISRACGQDSSTCRSTSATRRPSSQFFLRRRRAARRRLPARIAWHRRHARRHEATVLTIDANSGGELLDRAAAEAAQFETVMSRPDDLAAILYTSGTTGRSKGAALTHRNLASNALALVEAWGFTRGDVLLHALPIYHVHGLFVAVHCALLSGARMLWLPQVRCQGCHRVAAGSDRDDGCADVLHAPARASRRSRATHAAAIRLFVSGSAPLLPGDVPRVSRAHRAPILERYGMTETGMITSNPLDGVRAAAPSVARCRGFPCG